MMMSQRQETICSLARFKVSIKDVKPLLRFKSRFVQAPHLFKLIRRRSEARGGVINILSLFKCFTKVSRVRNTSDHGKEHKLYATAVPIANLLFGDLILWYISELVACPNDTR